jgi:dTDP-4-dehydrorhamnose reductase
MRTGYIYGEGAGGMDKRTRALISQVQRGEPIERAVDMIRTPIHVTDIAHAIWSLISQNRTGIVHLGETKQSVYTFTCKLAIQAGLNPSIIRPVTLRGCPNGDMIAADTSLQT